MANKTQTIRIESILGGHSQLSHVSGLGEFYASLGIDPAIDASDIGTDRFLQPSGLICPSPSQASSGTQPSKGPMWMINNPKDANIYVYDYQGSVYTFASNTNTVVSDGGSMSNARGNGCAYYDNYIYFAKNTTIARYGPLNGTPSFDGDYWSTTLAKTALADTTYPSFDTSTILPNHYLHRHSDGKLYIADVVGNQGTIHFVSTTKTTVEGDTDNGSTYNKLQFGYGLWPTAMESYGSSIVIGLYEGNGTEMSRQANAKVAFWDTTSSSSRPDQITWVEFPDQIITSIKNSNGNLYFFSCNVGQGGFRISRYIGGNAFEEIRYFSLGTAPLPGGVIAIGDQIMMGCSTGGVPAVSTQVLSYRLRSQKVSDGVFSILRGSTTGTATSICVDNNNSFANLPILGETSSHTTNRITITSGAASYSTNPSIWWSPLLPIGAPYKVTKIRIPLAQTVSSLTTEITPTLYLDDYNVTETLTTISNSNYPGSRSVVLRPSNSAGRNFFWLGLQWGSGSMGLNICLPITIEYELTDD